MKDEHKKYFINIISRLWAGGLQFNSKIDISKINENSEIESVYYEKPINDHVVFIAKSGHAYLLIEWYGDEDYKYSTGLFNNNLTVLLKSYSKKKDIMGSSDPESFGNSLILQQKLETTLNKDVDKKPKRTKI